MPRQFGHRRVRIGVSARREDLVATDAPALNARWERRVERTAAEDGQGDGRRGKVGERNELRHEAEKMRVRMSAEDAAERTGGGREGARLDAESDKSVEDVHELFLADAGRSVRRQRGLTHRGNGNLPINAPSARYVRITAPHRDSKHGIASRATRFDSPVVAE